MTKITSLFAGAAIAAVALMGAVSGAEAGHGHKGFNKFHFSLGSGYGHRHHRFYVDSGPSCGFYKHMYYKTGNGRWLGKYYACIY